MAGNYPLTWNNEGERFYETGVKKTVLYLKENKSTDQKPYAKGVAWNGVTSISESPSGAEATALYADDIKYLNLLSNEEFAASIEAYTYPDEFAECDGSAELVKGVSIGQQPRKQFGLCYRTAVGNDVDGTEKGYKLHLIYNCLAAPTEKSYATINDSPEAITFSWDISTTPVEIAGHKPTAVVTIDSTKLDEKGKTKLNSLEEILYGKDTTEPRLPLPDEIETLFKAN
ncbi:MAG: hypothetical protein SPI36_02510 [Candidatus Onthovivens sp.]|nr:hypothetical protein [Candidatus Onthovivens sp.]